MPGDPGRLAITYTNADDERKADLARGVIHLSVYRQCSGQGGRALEGFEATSNDVGSRWERITYRDRPYFVP